MTLRMQAARKQVRKSVGSRLSAGCAVLLDHTQLYI